MKKFARLTILLGIVTLITSFKPYHKTNEFEVGIFHLNIYSKNNAGWFHLNAVDIYSGETQPAAPNEHNGYYPVKSKQVYNMVLPNGSLNELSPEVGLFRENNGQGAPTRGGWAIEFDISCIGDDLVERAVTPMYKLSAKNYYDGLKRDDKGNDGFNIYLIRDFKPSDVTVMLNKNIQEYENFKRNTGRP